MESTNVKLYSLNYGNVRTYLAASLFIVGNILFPQFFHLIPKSEELIIGERTAVSRPTFHPYL